MESFSGAVASNFDDFVCNIRTGKAESEIKAKRFPVTFCSDVTGMSLSTEDNLFVDLSIFVLTAVVIQCLSLEKFTSGRNYHIILHIFCLISLEKSTVTKHRLIGTFLYRLDRVFLIFLRFFGTAIALYRTVSHCFYLNQGVGKSLAHFHGSVSGKLILAPQKVFRKKLWRRR